MTNETFEYQCEAQAGVEERRRIREECEAAMNEIVGPNADPQRVAEAAAQLAEDIAANVRPLGTPAIWLQDEEDEARAACGCTLVRDHLDTGNPAIIFCAAHAAAPTQAGADDVHGDLRRHAGQSPESQTFEVRRAELIRRVLPKRGRAYVHRCGRRAFEAIVHAIAESAGGFSIRDIAMHERRRGRFVSFTEVSVALAFLRDRGLIEVQNRRNFANAGTIVEEAMIEYEAIGEAGKAGA